jgi:hypothetical protein
MKLTSILFLISLAPIPSLLACAEEVPLEGGACPCANGFQCCEETGLCIDDQASCAHQESDGLPGAWRSGLQHPSCAQPVPAPLPALPAINTDAAGRPLFDYWRDLEPGSYEDSLCETSNTCPEGLCTQLAAGTSEGVCMSVDTDIWCDGEGEVLSWKDGGCWMCAPVESRAAACAAEIPGVDCRAWPYPSNGAPGAVCAAHEDCEPGLVCGPASDEGGNGYGLCQCPGLTSAPRRDPAC